VRRTSLPDNTPDTSELNISQYKNTTSPNKPVRNLRKINPEFRVQDAQLAHNVIPDLRTQLAQDKPQICGSRLASCHNKISTIRTQNQPSKLRKFPAQIKRTISRRKT
jgi:hypothetical protein